MIKTMVFFIVMLFSVVVVAQTGDLKFKNNTDCNEILITREAFSGLPQSEITTRTPWTPAGKAVTFRGVRIIDLLSYVNSSGNALKLHALDGYEIIISMDDIRNYNVLLADEMDGKKLGVRDFGPYFVIYPVDDYYETLNIPKYLSQFIRQVDEVMVKNE